MSGLKKKTPAEELIESLLKDVGEDAPSDSAEGGGNSGDGQALEGFVQSGDDGFKMTSDNTNYDEMTEMQYEQTRLEESDDRPLDLMNDLPSIPEAMGAMTAQNFKNNKSAPGRTEDPADLFVAPESIVTKQIDMPEDVKPPAYNNNNNNNVHSLNTSLTNNDSEKTVAVAGYQMRTEDNYDDRVKISVGKNRGSSSGYTTWNSGNSTESNLAQADHLRIAQDKILELESENEKLRSQNEELMAASEIIKERSDLLSSQLSEYKNDRDGLEESFKNEIVLLKNHLSKKDSELQKLQLKSDELDSRLKFDMKKIRVRERELENRLELIRAEKNAVVKNKDEQILDLRRKMDVLQMEVDSYRQKCVELNKLAETNQESFKRTTRALRLAMANLELQEENKVPMKKAE